MEDLPLGSGHQGLVQVQRLAAVRVRGPSKSQGLTAGPWASQISICMSGRLTPTRLFVAMGMFNEAVAERSFQGVTDRCLMDRLLAGQPICHDDGVPWTAMDFFGCYIGAVKPQRAWG